MNGGSDRLMAALLTLIDLAEKGNWDQISGLALDDFAPETKTDSNSPEVLGKNLKLLQRAMALCQERIEQISPLLDAFVPKRPDRP